MNIGTLLNIIVILSVIVIFVIVVVNFKREINKSVDKLTMRFDNYAVQNEYDKQDIYNRLEDLEENRK